MSPEELRRLFAYEPETGVVTRRVPMGRWGQFATGSIAGSITAGGYVEVQVDGARFYAHRLAFALMTGAWPEGQVDHINGVRRDNRWSNLREVSSLVNTQNQRRARSDSATGVLGVSLDRRLLAKPYRAQIQVNGKNRKLGYFATADEAHQAYVEAKRQQHEGCTL